LVDNILIHGSADPHKLVFNGKKVISQYIQVVKISHVKLSKEYKNTDLEFVSRSVLF